MLETRKVYQIFYKSHLGESKLEIARQLGVSRNCVLWHLSGRYLDQYDDQLFRRIRPFVMRQNHDLPDGKWIPLLMASYFFPDRPSPKSLSPSTRYRSHAIKTSVINGVRCTKRTWINDSLRGSDAPNGLLLTHSACRQLKIDVDPSSDKRTPLVPAFCVKLPQLPWEVIHRMIEIQDWTEMPFITLTRADL